MYFNRSLRIKSSTSRLRVALFSNIGFGMNVSPLLSRRMVSSPRVKSERLHKNLLEVLRSPVPSLHALINLPRLTGARLIFMQHVGQLHETHLVQLAIGEACIVSSLDSVVARVWAFWGALKARRFPLPSRVFLRFRRGLLTPPFGLEFEGKCLVIHLVFTFFVSPRLLFRGPAVSS